ncbi:hypothetical protein NQ314_005005 [Rhamnusium bicolor]|uniref:Major facilitator superfamily (MFS) profile domain-containing protein n=1 Tax=Rhamnusium bicolor TaxID=1586634 RepID=A0AAV8ZIJ3_9CUCU|nr:hypothetical protein NQ314_005005 [Rhamnusium bicolor]
MRVHIITTLSAVATGMVLAWTSPIQDDLEKGNFRGIILNNNQIGWIGSFVNLGALIMCIPTGFICDIIGRKKNFTNVNCSIYSRLVINFIC